MKNWKKYYNKEKHRISCMKWVNKNRERHREYDRKYKKEHYFPSKLRYKIIKLLGRKCVKCGFQDVRALQIDHIDGGGSKERKQYKIGGYNYYKYILSLSEIDMKSKYQILCANCNWIKRFENNEERGFKVNMEV